MVVLHGGVPSFKIKRFATFLRKPLLLHELLSLSRRDTRLIVIRHRKPWVIKHGLSGGSPVRIPDKHRHEEVSEGLSLGLVELVLLLEDFLEGPEVKTTDVAKVTS